MKEFRSLHVATHAFCAEKVVADSLIGEMPSFPESEGDRLHVVM